MNIEEELDSLLNDGAQDPRSLARELLEFKLREWPRLQTRITSLEIENETLRDIIAFFEAEVEHDGCSESDVTESELLSPTTYEGSNTSGGWERDSSSESDEFSDSSAQQDIMDSDGSNIASGWFETGSEIYLPADVLHIVFDFLIPPREMVGRSTIGGAKNSLCRSIRTKTTLALVCKAWHSVALKFLYGDVVLRRVNQILDFSRTVSEDSLTLGRLVKRLSINCFPPYGVTSDTQYATTSIFASCPSLQHLSVVGFLNTSEHKGHIILRTRHDTSADEEHKVKRIECNPTSKLMLWSLYIPSATFANLRSLEVVMWAEVVDSYAEALQLPLVDTLVLHLPNIYHPSRLQPFPGTWDMPSLKHLRFRCSNAVPLPAATTHDLKFFDRYGPNLVSLDFGPHITTETNESLWVESAIGKCSSLKHLVIHSSFRASIMLRNLPHRALAHLDLVVQTMHMHTTNELVAHCRTQSGLVGPGWRSVRFFEKAVLEILPDLPHCPALPRSRAEHDGTGRVYSYGYPICVVPSRCGDTDVPELIFYEHRVDSPLS